MPDKEARDFIWMVLNDYTKRKAYKKLSLEDRNIFQNIILTYLHYVEKPQFHIIIDVYKRLYINSESLIENNFSEEEVQGLAEVYDYISAFNFDKDYFNIFTTSLLIHIKLYSKCVGKEFGGKLRDSTAILYDTNYEVPDAETAKEFFNGLIPISNEIFAPLEKGEIFEYIESCVILTVRLIRYQPFADGNKRTFRALLNLLLKRINILPIYIELEERQVYKQALLKAIKEEDYHDIINFYYYKICSSLVTLDLNHTKYYDTDFPIREKI